VADAYIASVNEREAQGQAGGSGLTAAMSRRYGSGEVRVTEVEVLDPTGRPNPVLVTGQACIFRTHYLARTALDGLTFGLGFMHESNVNVAGPNSGRVGPFSIEPGAGFVDFQVEDLLLQAGSYRISSAIVDRGHIYDYADQEFDLRVRGRGDDEPGLTRMPGAWLPPVHAGTPASAEVEPVRAQ
jgi:ABC-2 type transport system ATP-binding protein/lipopolysaccharide transport system ATP-binding protein